ncbi:hypothetical protein SMC26_16545 [Actinomadura fulvescens]|uniref:Integral membrane protein n=2 Tax=Actinomadura fulvescens TaxID=46160 RepID=A0ABN3PKI5_9ACTN
MLVDSYARQEVVVLKRPRDGAEPREVVLVCGSCRERLTYRVFSVRAARRARRMWTALGLAGVGLVPLCVLVPNGVVAIVLALAGFGLALGSFTIVSRDIGVAGPGRLWRWPHYLAVPTEERTGALPTLRCDRCGHREPFAVGDFHDAKARLAQHTCPADGN